MKKQPIAPSVAEFYHQQTIYSPRNLSSFVPDPDSRPALFRDYLTENAIDLRTDLESCAVSQGVIDNDASVERLARLLHHTAGITTIHETVEGPFYLRAAPSAGGLYPNEVYLVTRGLTDIPDGIHSYSAKHSALVPLWDGDFGVDVEELCFRHAGTLRAQAFLVLTGVFQKGAWRYRERAYRRILLDCGHLLGNAVAYAPLEGFQLVTIAGFYDSGLNDLLFLDTRDEVVLLVLPIIDLESIRDVRINSPFPFPSRKHVHDLTRPADDGVMRLLHRRSEIVPDDSLVARVPTKPLTLARPQPSPDRETLFLVPEQQPSAPQLHLHDIGHVVRHRRSTRRFDRTHISLQTLEKVLRFAYDPAKRYWAAAGKGLALSSCIFADPTLLTTHIVVLRVDEVRPGVYLYDPEQRSLHLQRHGFFEKELHQLCLHQDLGSDAAAAVIHTADLPLSVRRYGDRAYRYMHLDAGHIGQRINLAAIGSGIGVSGIGGFFDEDVNRLLELPATSIATYITVLGNPANE